MSAGIASIVFLAAAAMAPPAHVTIRTQDGGVLAGDMYGQGERGLVLAHGGRFNKESWEKQAQASPPPAIASWRSTSAVTAHRAGRARAIP